MSVQLSVPYKSEKFRQLRIGAVSFYFRAVSTKDADGMANSIDPV